MYKKTRWAQQILSLQDKEGKWGYFHTLSKFYNSPITTERALDRLRRLGYTIEDECIQKACDYMNRCLNGEIAIPDRIEGDERYWDVFVKLMLACRIREFTDSNSSANQIAEKWAQIITAAFKTGCYNEKNYFEAFYKAFALPIKGDRLKDFVNYYIIAAVAKLLDGETQHCCLDYILNHEKGIYYVYPNKLALLPDSFIGLKASRYLGAMELLSRFSQSPSKLGFVVEWLEASGDKEGFWDMGAKAKDKVYFPLSDNWSKAQIRRMDCTHRIKALLAQLSRQSGE